MRKALDILGRVGLGRHSIERSCNEAGIDRGVNEIEITSDRRRHGTGVAGTNIRDLDGEIAGMGRRNHDHVITGIKNRHEDGHGLDRRNDEIGIFGIGKRSQEIGMDRMCKGLEVGTEHRTPDLDTLVRRSFWDDLTRVKEKIVRRNQVSAANHIVTKEKDIDETAERDSWYRTSRRFSDSRYKLELDILTINQFTSGL